MFSQFSWNRPLYSLIYDLIFWSTICTPWHYWPPKYFSFVWFLIFPFIHRCICFAHTGSCPVWETAAKCNPKRPNSWRWVCTDLVSLLPCGKSILKPIWVSGMVNFCLRSWNTLWSGLVWFWLVLQGGFLSISTEQMTCSQHPELFWHAKPRFSFWKWTHQVISVHTEGASFLAYIHLFSFLCFFLYHFFCLFFLSGAQMNLLVIAAKTT